MSVSGISSTNFVDTSNQSVQTKQEEIQKEFQQLGQDLQSGNVSAAQSDFATIQQLVPKLNAGSPQSYDPLVRAFTKLGQDLQSGDTSAAQQDYAKIQQVFQNRAQQAQGVHHAHHGKGDNGQTSAQTVADSTGVSVDA
jgi:outer membrane protein assembly factor BamD (BamD/ComL family)